MTVAEVMAAQHRGEFGAAGWVQAIPSTLAMAPHDLGLRGDEKYDVALQNRIFQYIITKKQPAIAAYINGGGDKQAALSALAGEWASFTDPATGQSRYAGISGNRASISVAEADRALEEMRRQAAPAGPGGLINPMGNLPPGYRVGAGHARYPAAMMATPEGRKAAADAAAADIASAKRAAATPSDDEQAKRIQGYHFLKPGEVTGGLAAPTPNAGAPGYKPYTPDPALQFGARAAAAVQTANVDNSRSVETNINGDINIHTAATDAKGIMRGIHSATALVWNANTGLS
jgi:hypothetical protein